MKEKFYTLLVILGISLFCGIVGISVGLGSFFPQMNQVAKPFVCGRGTLDVKQTVAHYRPGGTSWSIDAYCVSPSGAKTDVTFSTQMVAGAIYSVIPFVIIVAWILYAKIRGEPDEPAENISRSRKFKIMRRVYEDHPSDSIEKKLEKLKELRAANLISEEDYQKKKDMILEKL